MVKLALVSNTSHSLQNFHLQLIHQLQQQGYQILLIAPVDERTFLLPQTKNIQFIPLKKLRTHSKNPFHDLQFYQELKNIYRRYCPVAVIHFTIKPNIYGTLAAAHLGIPSLAVITGLGYTFLHENLAAQVAKKLYRFSLKKASQVIFLNNDDRSLFIQKQLVLAEKAQVIAGSGINVEHFKPSTQVADNQLFTFIFIGRLLYDKGIRELVAASRLLKKEGMRFQVQLLGDRGGDYPASVTAVELQEWEQQGLVTPLGSTLDVRPFLAQADALILPSYREGVPRAVLEALAMEKPVITTLTAGCRETVEDSKNGYLVPTHNAVSLAKAMTRLIKMPSVDIQQMGQYGRQKVLREFADKVVLKKYLALIQQILHSI